MNGNTNQHQAQSAKIRIRSVDIMRGLAMSLVMLSHSRNMLDRTTLSELQYNILKMSTNIASVAFMFVSGMMISYFFFYRPNWNAVYRRFARRAFFLFVPVHFMLHLATYYYFHDAGGHLTHDLLYNYNITSTIAIALITAPLIIRYTSRRLRAVVAGLFIASAPPVVAFWHPDPGVLNIIRIVFFGPAGDTSPEGLDYYFPLFPFVGIFLIGSFLGEKLSESRKGNISMGAFIGNARKNGWVFLLLGLSLTSGYMLIKKFFGGLLDMSFMEAIYPTRTTTLLPLYIGILLLAFSFLFNHIDLKGNYNRPLWWFSILGRTSLFTFVTHFIFIWTLPSLIGVRWKLNVVEVFLLFLIGFWATWICSYCYGRLRGWIKPDDFQKVSGKPTLPMAS